MRFAFSVLSVVSFLVPALHRKIYALVSRIPEGTVATYGQIAEIVGTGPRQVGRALAETPPGIRCPWHRVVNARGEVSLRAGSGTAHLRQRKRLEAEGIVFHADRVDLDVYRWFPEA